MSEVRNRRGFGGVYERKWEEREVAEMVHAMLDRCAKDTLAGRRRRAKQV